MRQNDTSKRFGQPFDTKAHQQVSGNMKSLFYSFVRFIRRQMWSFIVAYMLGMHNFYKGEDKTPDNIVITIEYNQAQDDGTPLE